jgi:hypothetical protein
MKDWRYEATKRGRVEDVKRLLAAGAAVDGDGFSQQLNQAARCGYAEIVRLLLAAGANVNIDLSKDGKTPLWFALAWGRWGAALLLLFHGGRLRLKKTPIALWAGLWETMLRLALPVIVLLEAVAIAAAAAMLHRLAPSFPVWGTGVVGAAAGLAAVFCLRAVSAKGYHGCLILAWAALAAGTTAVLHRFSPWCPTWVSAAVLGGLAAPILCPLVFLWPELSALRAALRDQRRGGKTGIATFSKRLSEELMTFWTGLTAPTLSCQGCGRAYRIGVDAVVITMESTYTMLDVAIVFRSGEGLPDREDLVASLSSREKAKESARENWWIVQNGLKHGERRVWRCHECRKVNAYH